MMSIVEYIKGNFTVFAWVILLLQNLIGITITVVDKKKAELNKWRIPEATLLIVAMLGGSFGMYITMKRIHHKTKKKKFMIGLPLIMIIQVGLYIYFFKI